jgi:hypothetical protein
LNLHGTVIYQILWPEERLLELSLGLLWLRFLHLIGCALVLCVENPKELIVVASLNSADDPARTTFHVDEAFSVIFLSSHSPSWRFN